MDFLRPTNKGTTIKGKITMSLSGSNGFLLSGEGLPGRHSTKFILIDSEAQILGYYEYSDEKEFNALKSDATYLLNRL